VLKLFACTLEERKTGTKNKVILVQFFYTIGGPCKGFGNVLGQIIYGQEMFSFFLEGRIVLDSSLIFAGPAEKLETGQNFFGLCRSSLGGTKDFGILPRLFGPPPTGKQSYNR
jgi:hypothetical protein